MTQYAYVGTYTQDEHGKEHRAEGIYIYQVDPASGKLSLKSKALARENPSFLRMHPSKKYLYAVNELVEGKVSSFAVNPANGELTWLNSQPTKGMHPCYVSFDPAGKFMLIANYSSGSLAVFPILPDGTLAPMSDLIEHQGKGPNPHRQERAHAHSIAFDPSGKFALAADLGIDQILVYRLDPVTGKLSLNDPPHARMHPGAGPRHFSFHPNGNILYCANELDGTVSVCQWNDQTGILSPYQTLPTLPAGFTQDNTVADIHLDSSAKTLYVSNRGHNSLAVFRVLADGSLTPLTILPCGGNWPRNFALDGQGKWLYVANQYSSDLVQFRLNPDSGLPEATGEVYAIPSPVCVEIVTL
jgi:6-phosphogluconolactonase